MIMMLALLMQSATTGSNETRFNACANLVERDAVAAQKEAETWRDGGGGLLARHCLGLAFVVQERFAPATLTFEQAAKDAAIQRDGRAAFFYVQAANAALAGDDPARARPLFDSALAMPTLSPLQQGEAHLDRARALVLLNDSKGARADIDTALTLVPEDPLGWLLSATLARRMGDLTRAEADIGEAMKKSPDDAAVAFEAGNIAWSLDAPKAAQTAWERAAEADPKGPVGDNARRALAAFIEDPGMTGDQGKAAAPATP
jgi:tetratricopeptide (TPR) repeat protein